MVGPGKKTRRLRRKRRSQVAQCLNGRTSLGSEQWDKAIQKYIETGEIDYWNLPASLAEELRKKDQNQSPPT